MNYQDINITKYLQSGFRIERNGYNIYIDSFRIPDDQPTADVIFITHEHPDHCDPSSIGKIYKHGHTWMLSNQLVAQKLGQFGEQNWMEISPDIEMSLFDDEPSRTIGIKTIPAYNLDKFRSPGQLFHPRENNGVGLILQIGGVTILHMGDTDFTPELRQMKGIDIAMVPVSGTYVMTAAEAVEAINEINPQIAIPMHHDAGAVGSPQDAEILKEGANCKVEILLAVR